MAFLLLLVAYSGGLVLAGWALSRSVRSTKDFFVAGRDLPSGLIFATFLAANIGAGSTVGATGLGYRLGLSAFWWVASAGLGSLVMAFFVGPKIYEIARRHDLYTVGDFLEMRYDRRVRLLLAGCVWLGSLAILAGQLIAIAWILNVVAGVSRPVGCTLGGIVVTAYFAAGGLRATAWLNVIQLAMKMVGFFVAVPWALQKAGGWAALAAPPSQPGYFSPVGIGMGGVLGYVVILAPAFFLSPGLVQKLYGARDEHAVRWGVGWQAAVLLVYAFLPALLGMTAHSAFPNLANPELALPTVLKEMLPWWMGALLLGAVFSAELSASDAVLFMISTSLGKDLYKAAIHPAADDAAVLRATRWAAFASGGLGILLAISLPSVIDALTIYYSLLSVVLLVPFVAGLYLEFPTGTAALAAMIVSLAVFVAANLLNAAYPPALGIGAGAMVMAGYGAVSHGK